MIPYIFCFSSPLYFPSMPHFRVAKLTIIFAGKRPWFPPTYFYYDTLNVVSHFVNFLSLVVSFCSTDTRSTYDIVFLLPKFQIFSFLQNAHTCAEPRSLLSKEHRVIRFGGHVASVHLTTYFYLVWKIRISGVVLHSPHNSMACRRTTPTACLNSIIQCKFL